MKTSSYRTITCGVLLLICTMVRAQSAKVSSYEYWVDQDFANRTSVEVSGNVVETAANFSTLADGMHSLRLRVIDSNNRCSAVYTKYFLVTSLKGHDVNSLTDYRYWIDNNTDDAVEGSVGDNGIVNLVLDASALAEGMHALHYQVKDLRGFYSAVLTAYFLKTHAGIANNSLTGYRYWIDNNTDDTVEGSVGDDGIVNLVLDASALAEGMHALHFQVKDLRGLYSAAHTTLFMKTTLRYEGNLVAYEYWFNNGSHNRVEVAPQPSLTIENALLTVENVVPHAIGSDYRFDAEADCINVPDDVEFGFYVVADNEVHSTAVTQTIPMDVPVALNTIALNEKEEVVVAAPTGGEAQGFSYNCPKGYGLVFQVEGADVKADFFDADGNRVEPLRNEAADGKKDYTVLPATDGMIYMVLHSATGIMAGNTVMLTVSVPTDLERISLDLKNSPADVFSISGMKVRSDATSLNGLPAGVYIVNGRRVAVP